MTLSAIRFGKAFTDDIERAGQGALLVETFQYPHAYLLETEPEFNPGIPDSPVPPHMTTNTKVKVFNQTEHPGTFALQYEGDLKHWMFFEDGDRFSNVSLDLRVPKDSELELPKYEISEDGSQLSLIG